MQPIESARKGVHSLAGQVEQHDAQKVVASSTKALLPQQRHSITRGQVAILVFALFMKGGLLGAYVPFSALWLSRKGYTARHLGIVALVDASSSLFLPLIGGAVDRLRAHNTGFVGILLVLTCLKLAYLPAAHSFPCLLLLTAMSAPLTRAASGLLDALALHAFPEKGHYSRARLFGDLGFGCIAFSTGIAMDSRGTEDIIYWRFAEICAFIAVMWMMAAPYMSNIRPDSKSMTTAEFCVQLRLLGRNLRRWGIIRALFVLYLLGAAIGVIGMFEFVLLKKMLGSGLLLGSCKLLGSLLAIPCWWYVAPLMDKLGFKNIQLIALAACVMRLYILGIITRPEHALLAEAFCGMGGFAFAYSSITIFAGRFVEEDMKATTQTTLFVIYVGLGAGGAPILGAFMVELYGIQGMYLCAAAVLGTVWVIAVVFDLLDHFVFGTYRALEDSCEVLKGELDEDPAAQKVVSSA